MTVKELLELYEHDKEIYHIGYLTDDIQIEVWKQIGGKSDVVYDGFRGWLLDYPGGDNDVQALFEKIKRAQVKDYCFKIDTWLDGNMCDFTMIVDIGEDL